MITRAKLVEQLRDYNLRSQQKRAALVIFSPKHQITTRYFSPIFSNKCALYRFFFIKTIMLDFVLEI
uniref:Uncharacterized protein n=1 Tax=Nelumbo nucifera TaxID=4432 RepID=A0A822XMS6_NELNU|nr:TPA_asm: hypothetical protein HUJ06_023143 [Nelumbo nucifera]